MLEKLLVPFSFKLRRKIHDLKVIFFEITDSCNINCIHCGSDCIKSDKNTELAPDIIIKTLKDIKKKYKSHNILVILSGGEPVLYKELNKLTYEINKLEFPWGLVSNGFAWSDNIFNIFKNNNLASVTISLDGLEEEHNWLRGHKSSFKNALKTIKRLSMAPFYQVMDVITCVNKKNIYKLDNIKDLLISLGVKKWRLFTISPIGRASTVPELFLNETEYKYMLDKVLEYKHDKNINLDLAACSYLGQNYELKIKEHRFFCKAGINVAGIMVNGDILACPNIDRRFKQGNIYKDNFINVWEKKYYEFRNRSWMKNGACKTCSDWNYCQGEGFHLRDYETKKTKLCHINEFKLY